MASGAGASSLISAAVPAGVSSHGRFCDWNGRFPARHARVLHVSSTRPCYAASGRGTVRRSLPLPAKRKDCVGRLLPAASLSGAPGADPAAEGCDNCRQGYLWAGQPTGTEIELDGVPAYLALPEEGPAQEGKAILYIHDVLGWEFSNSRQLCDRLASATGMAVYLPDFFEGETPMSEELTAFRYKPDISAMEQLASGLRFAVSIPTFLLRVTKFNAQKVEPTFEKVLSAIKGRHGGVEGCKLGAVGYCWGGKYSLRLGARGLVGGSVACHPSLVSVSDDKLNEMSAPALFLCAPNDNAFSEKLWAEAEAAIKAAPTPVPLERVVYPGTTHGFTVRCNEADVTALAARNNALKRTAEWFTKYLV